MSFSGVLRFFGAFFVTVTIAGYKYETASQQRDPNDFSVPSNGRRSKCMITFEIALPGVISAMTEARYNDIASNGRSVPFPQQVLSKVRKKRAREKAVEAARTSGCPCIMKGYAGEDDG